MSAREVDAGLTILNLKKSEAEAKPIIVFRLVSKHA
jgi:hypothetical protein